MVFTAYEGGQTRETRVARLRRKEEMKMAAKREKIGVQRHIRIADSEMNAQKNRGAAAYPNCRQRDERADRTAHGTARL